jgi:hypothetical protein
MSGICGPEAVKTCERESYSVKSRRIEDLRVRDVRIEGPATNSFPTDNFPTNSFPTNDLQADELAVRGLGEQEPNLRRLLYDLRRTAAPVVRERAQRRRTIGRAANRVNGHPHNGCGVGEFRPGAKRLVSRLQDA